MDFATALRLTADPELAIKLMEADAAQRKSEALFSIANTLSQISRYDGLRIDIR